MKLTNNKQVKRECAAILEGIRVCFFKITDLLDTVIYFFDLSNITKPACYMRKVRAGIKLLKFILKIKIGKFCGFD